MLTLNSKYIWYFIFFFTVAAFEPLVLVFNLEGIETLIPIIRYFTLVLFVSIFILTICSRFSNFVFIGFFSVSLALTLVSFRVANHPFFSKLSILMCMIILISSIFIIAMICIPLFRNNRSPGIKIYVLTFIVGIASPVTQFLISDKQYERLNNTESHYKMTDKPNIYLLNYDSMIPASLGKKFFNFNEIPYEAAILDNYHEFPNSLSFHIPTKRSINDVMRLGQVNEPLNYAAFSGNVRSLLGTLLKQNGYEIVTGFPGIYFGNTGPHIDNGLFPTETDIQSSVICLAQRRFQKMQAGMICEVAFRAYRSKYLRPFYGMIFGNTLGQVLKNWDDLVMENVKDVSISGKPTLFYVATNKGIGHTSSSYDHDDLIQRENYRAQYWENAHIVARQVTNVSDTIKISDPNSVVVIFGDHGTYLSRSINFEDNPEFFMKDRHRVAMAVRKNGHRCSNPKFLNFEVEYHTPARLVHSILKCLGNGDIVEYEECDEDKTVLKYSLSN